MKRMIIAAVALAVLCGMQLWAQAPRKFSMGLYGAYNLNMHQVNFADLPNVPIFSPRTGGANEPANFKSVNTGDFAVGLVMEYALAKEYGVALRLSYATQNALLRTTANYRVGRSDGTQADATSEYTLDTKMQTFGIEPLFYYNVIDNLSIYAGARVNIATGSWYSQQENLLAPADGGFFSGAVTGRTRNVSSAAALPNVQSTNFAAVVGVGYAVEVVNRLSIVPEAFYSFGILPVVSGLPSGQTWTVNSLRAGISVKYKL